MIGSVKREGDYAVIRIPLAEVHSLRVALAPCPCKGHKTISTGQIRDRLERALATVDATSNIPDPHERGL